MLGPMVALPTSFSIRRSLGSILILWIGGLAHSRVLDWAAGALHSLLGGSTLHAMLVLAVGVLLLIFIFYAAALWYFRDDRGGAAEGFILAFVAAAGWHIATALQNTIMFELDYGVTVYHLGVLGWTLLIVVFTVFGAAQTPRATDDRFITSIKNSIKG